MKSNQEAIITILNNLSNMTDNMETKKILAEAKQKIDELAVRNSFPLTEEEINLVNKKCIIEAIKTYRNRTGCALVTAKTVVDNYRDSIRGKQFQCPKCRGAIVFGMHLDTIEQLKIEGATTNCPHCEALLLIEGGKAHDFHKKIAKGCPQWPEDGVGTGFTKL